MRHAPSVRHRLVTLAVTMPVCVAGAVLLAAPASAAACSGADCNGLSAQDTGCDADARVIATDVIQRSQYDPSIRVELPTGPVYGEVLLWESPTCNAVWTTATQPLGSGLVLTTGVTTRTAPDSDGNSATLRSTTGLAVTSAMWSPTPTAPAAYYAGGWAYVDNSPGSPPLGYPLPQGQAFVAR